LDLIRECLILQLVLEIPNQLNNFLLSRILSQRVNQCLRDACSASTIPYCDTFIDCGHSSYSAVNREKWSNDSSSTACFNTGNDATFQYGIYQQAVLLTTERSAVKRYIYSLFWGFQVHSISCFLVYFWICIFLLHPTCVLITPFCLMLILPSDLRCRVMMFHSFCLYDNWLMLLLIHKCLYFSK
jgi:hypothetical protein